ncbi:TetR family transcriptional regulator [Paenibacillus sp. J23TS9]|uniref:dihydroxyacetone kinase transcriptional activator DhaS n=1 Tax=Paenibacillus sp. J23TS9 TaxID=2807193 RepID=UPI001B2E0862|nr:dihydroxyacetone kinase transcriptional activator DhaS [Paenibacillus sp. J23TS9]GIP30100.1 TetR family transcriptional regulator [Paenibacillus sp. J23TS9]
MSESQITKRAIAASLKELTAIYPLSKISVKQIVDHCGLNRQTFYYHFKDKFDLVNWIYYTEAVESISDCSDYERWTDGISRILSYLGDNRIFYINALNTPGQNAFGGYLFEATHNLIMSVVHEVSFKRNISQADQSFIADFYTFAFVGIVVKWVKGSMKERPEEIVERIRDIVTGTLQPALMRYEGSSQPTDTGK